MIQKITETPYKSVIPFSFGEKRLARVFSTVFQITCFILLFCVLEFQSHFAYFFIVTLLLSFSFNFYEISKERKKALDKNRKVKRNYAHVSLKGPDSRTRR